MSRKYSLFVVSLTLILLAPARANAQNEVPSRYLATYHIFPQFADGRLSDGSYYRTTLTVSNPSDIVGTDCTVQLRGVTLPGFALNYSMPPGGWIISSTSGAQNFQSGYATLDCSTNVEPQLMY